MKTPRTHLTRSRISPTRSLLCGILLFLDTSHLLLAQPTLAAVNAFNDYARATESRLVQQHRTADTFLILQNPIADRAQLRAGSVLIERIPTPQTGSLSGALLHHWRGTAFAPGAHAADFERLMRNFNAYPQRFAPQVTAARVVSENGDHLQAWMRVRQRHVITVVMDTSYDVAFASLDTQHGYSLSRSTRIEEIANPGSSDEHALSAADEHGFLWRMNTYWSYEERDGGLYLQIESITLTRSIPTGLAWAVRPYIESIPRESMEFTLRSACAAIRK